MKRFALFCMVALATTVAQAAVDIIILQVGDDVVVTATGTADVSALTLAFSGNGSGTHLGSDGRLFVGSGFVSYDQYSGVTGPTSFGPDTGDPFGNPFFPDQGSGGLIGIDGDNAALRVPGSYVSGTPITGEMTYENETFETLFLTRGVYTWTWGGGGADERLTLTIGDPNAPVPASSWWSLSALALVMLAGLLGVATRLRAA